jgi:hypothetical protein
MRNEEENQKKLVRLLSQLKPPEGLKSKNYKAYSLLKKMDGSYSLKLMFGYNNKKTKEGKRNTNPIYGSSFEFKGREFLSEIIDVLEYGLSVEEENILFSGIGTDKIEESW